MRDQNNQKIIFFRTNYFRRFWHLLPVMAVNFEFYCT